MALSTFLFNLCLAKVVRNTKTNIGRTILNRTRQCLLYTDDVVVGYAMKDIAETIENRTNLALQIGLTVNVCTIKYRIK